MKRRYTMLMILNIALGLPAAAQEEGIKVKVAKGLLEGATTNGIRTFWAFPMLSRRLANCAERFRS